MKRRVAIVSLCILSCLAAPSLFAGNCHDCPEGTDCIQVAAGPYICGWNPDGSCYSLGGGGCRSGFSLQADYRVAAVHVIEQGKPIPQAQPKPAVQTAAK